MELEQFMQQEAGMRGSRQREALEEIEASFENIRAAWIQAVQRRNFAAVDAMIDGLMLFTQLRGRYADGDALFALAREGLAPAAGEKPHPVYGRVLCRYTWAGNEKPEALIQQALEIAEQQGNQAEIAQACFELAQVIKWWHKDFERALPLFERCLSISRKIGNHYLITRSLLEIGGAHAYMGRPEKMAENAQAALEISQEKGDQVGAAMALTTLASIALANGHLSTAEALGRQAINIHRDFGNAFALADGRLGLAVAFPSIFRAGPDLDEALRLVDEVQRTALNYQHQGGIALSKTLLGYHAARNGDYLTARELAMAATEAAPEDPVQWTLGYGLLAYAEAGLGNYRQALQRLYPAIQATVVLGLDAFFRRLMPVVALYMAHERNQPERAAEIFAFAFDTDLESARIQRDWPLYAELEAALRGDLGTVAFTAAGERGRALRMDEIMQDLASEFE